MGKFFYHFSRIVAILVVAGFYVWLLYIIANDGKWIKAIFTGALGLVGLFTFGHWLYSGFFIRRSFWTYLSRYKQRRFRKRIRSGLIGYAVGVCAVAAIRFAVGDNPLTSSFFYILMLGIGLLLLLTKIISGYIQYCYKKD